MLSTQKQRLPKCKYGEATGETPVLAHIPGFVEVFHSKGYLAQCFKDTSY